MSCNLLLTQRNGKIQSDITGNFSGNSGDGNYYGDGVNITTNYGGVNYYQASGQNGSIRSEDVPAGPSWMVPYSRNKRFIGRGSILELLGEQVRNGNGLNRIALQGLGGSGKTQIALEYVYRCKDTCHIFWVNASCFHKFQEDYERIAREAKIPVRSETHEGNKEEILKGVKMWFESSRRGDWILLLDNADDVADFETNNSAISKFLPQGPKGNIIVTTRSLAVAQREGCDIITVGKVSDSEARELFSRQLRIPHNDQTKDEQAISNLIDFLGHLPLAITGAAAFMRETSISPSNYWSLIQESDKKAKQLLLSEFRVPGREADMTESILSTFFLTFDRICLQMPLAANVLQLIAFLDRQNIPKDLIVQSGLEGVSDSLNFWRAIGILLGFSLVSEERGGEVYELHRLVQLSVHVYLSHRDACQWKRRAMEVVSRLYPEYNHGVRDVCTIYLPHALAVIKDSTGPIVDELHYRLASHLHNMGYYNEAEIHIRQCIAEGRNNDEILAGTLGLFKPHAYLKLMLRLLTELLSPVLRYIWLLLFPGYYEYYRRYWKRRRLFTMILERQGRYTEAESLSREVLIGTATILGAEHPETRASVNNLAAVLVRLGKYPEAEKMFLCAVQETSGAARPQDLFSLHNLGLVVCQQGRCEEVEGMLRCALKSEENFFRSEHPDTLATLQNLAWVLANLGKFEEAEELYRQVLDCHQRSLHPNHSNTLECINNLARVLEEQGKLWEAEEAYIRALEGFEKSLGLEHTSTLKVRKNLASFLSEPGQCGKDMQMLSCTLQNNNKLLGLGHSVSMITLQNIDSDLNKQRLGNNLEQALQSVMDLLEKVFGPDRPYTLASVRKLAHLQSLLGNHHEAFTLNLPPFFARATYLEPEHPYTLASLESLARCISNLGEQANTEYLHDRASPVISTMISGKNHATSKHLHKLVKALQRLEQLFSRGNRDTPAVPAREKLLGAEPPAMISNLQNPADVVGEVEIYLDSVRMLGKELATCQRSLEVGQGDTEEYRRRRFCFIFMKLYDGGSRECTRKVKAKVKEWEQEAATGGGCAGVMDISTLGTRNYWCVKYITSKAYFPVLPCVLFAFFLLSFAVIGFLSSVSLSHARFGLIKCHNILPVYVGE